MNRSPISSAVQDLGLGQDMAGKSQEEIDAMKKKRKAMSMGGDAGMSPAVAALMSSSGNQF